MYFGIVFKKSDVDLKIKQVIDLLVISAGLICTAARCLPLTNVV